MSRQRRPASSTCWWSSFCEGGALLEDRGQVSLSAPGYIYYTPDLTLDEYILAGRDAGGGGEDAADGGLREKHVDGLHDSALLKPGWLFDGAPAVLKDWFHEMRQQSVTTDDFVTFAKAKTGQDFGAFFKEWNAITKVPTFNGEVKPAGNKASVTLSKPAGIPSGIEVPLRLEGAGGKSKTVLVKPGDRLEVDAGFAVKKFSWDPERTVLADVR